MIELDDPIVTRTHAELVSLIDSYRFLVGAPLDRTTLHEGTGLAVADFQGADDPAGDTLRRIAEAQQREAAESR